MEVTLSRLRRVSMLVVVGAAVAAAPASAHDELSYRLDALSSGALRAGKHTLQVFGTDDLGNAGPVASDSWKVTKKKKKK